MKKLTAVLMALILSVGMIFANGGEVKAASTEKEIDSEVTSELSGEISTWGVYLGSGTSGISNAGGGKIIASGTTIGQAVVSRISVSVRVERLLNGQWASYTSWTANKYNAVSVHSSKTLSVPTGYYYRVHCTHWANSDSSGSVTNGIYI